MWVRHLSSLQFLSYAAFFGVVIAAVFAFLPGRKPPVRTEPFSDDEVEIPLTNKLGTGTTSVTFSQPGRYVLLVQSIETLRNSFEYHCCWTNGWVEVNVTN